MKGPHWGLLDLVRLGEASTPLVEGFRWMFVLGWDGRSTPSPCRRRRVHGPYRGGCELDLRLKYRFGPKEGSKGVGEILSL